MGGKGAKKGGKKGFGKKGPSFFQPPSSLSTIPSAGSEEDKESSFSMPNQVYSGMSPGAFSIQIYYSLIVPRNYMITDIQIHIYLQLDLLRKSKDFIFWFFPLVFLFFLFFSPEFVVFLFSSPEFVVYLVLSPEFVDYLVLSPEFVDYFVFIP